MEETVSEFFILFSATEEVHDFSTSMTCHPTQLNTATCKICGYTCSGTSAGARFLLAEPSIWHHGGNVAITYNNYKATVALTNADAWGWASRNVHLKTTDYICFTATGKFKVEIRAKDATEGVTIIAEKAYAGERIVVPVSDIVKEDGEYSIFLYVIPEEGVEETVSEFFILSNETEDVHRYQEGRTECLICGKQKGIFESLINKIVNIKE